MNVSEEPATGRPEFTLGSPGRMFVELVACVERRMHAAAREYPAVDHLAPHPSAPTVEQLDTLGRQLVEWASPALHTAFERWRCASRDFEAAVRELAKLHTEGREGEPDFDVQLEQRIHALRDARVALTRAGSSLCEQVATELDAAMVPGSRE